MKASIDRESGSGVAPALAAEVARERILVALGLTRRPLRSTELANALGLGLRESDNACRWLAQNGLIRSAGESGGDAGDGWSLLSSSAQREAR
jgi:hypothetical protein